MQSDRSYDDLMQEIHRQIRYATPALTVKVGSFGELLVILDQIEKSFLFIVSAEPQVFQMPHYNKAISSGQGHLQDSVIELDLARVAKYLEEYFFWFGTVEKIYVLGTSVLVFKMKHMFSVANILKRSQHEVGIPHDSIGIDGDACPVSILDSLPCPRVSAFFTVHPFNGESLSLNAILSLLKTVDPATVVMVRRVNRLGFNGSDLVKKYFERFGKVMRVFMLPLRSRKKNLTLPSKTGFILMESKQACVEILSTTEHVVAPGMSVSVGTFTHRGLIANTLSC
jgi:hypothetical protein